MKKTVNDKTVKKKLFFENNVVKQYKAIDKMFCLCMFLSVLDREYPQ